MVKQNDLFGPRRDKYEWLQNTVFDTAIYNKIDANKPFYFFVPRSTNSIRYYLDWPQINKIFPTNVTGIVTARDSFVIDVEKKELKRRVEQFRDLSLSDEMIREIFNLNNTRGWNLTNARKKLAKDQNWDDHFQKILYRPFDIRNIYYTPIMIDWGRPDVMHNMIEGDNLSLCFMRQFSGNMPYTHVLVSENIVDNRTFFSSKGIIQQAPLYLYPNKEQGNLFLREKKANISNQILSKIENCYDQTIIPETFLSYIYAVCYSNIYREKFDEFLRIDFPRVPFTNNFEIFKEVSKLGKRLIDLHLLRNSEMTDLTAKFKGHGEDLMIDKRLYDEENKRVYINQDYYFEGIAPEVWEYQVGGYQVLDKYLKDRKGHRMDDPRHYIHIATALEKTIEIQAEIDTIYPEVEKDVIEFEQ